MRDWLNRQSTGKTLIRGLYMVLFWLALTFTVYIFGLVVIAQFLFILISRKPNANLLKAGRNIVKFIKQIADFLTFNSEKLPFPFE